MPVGQSCFETLPYRHSELFAGKQMETARNSALWEQTVRCLTGNLVPNSRCLVRHAVVAWAEGKLYSYAENHLPMMVLVLVAVHGRLVERVEGRHDWVEMTGSLVEEGQPGKPRTRDPGCQRSDLLSGSLVLAVVCR